MRRWWMAVTIAAVLAVAPAAAEDFAQQEAERLRADLEGEAERQRLTLETFMQDQQTRLEQKLAEQDHGGSPSVQGPGSRGGSTSRCGMTRVRRSSSDSQPSSGSIPPISGWKASRPPGPSPRAICRQSSGVTMV